MHRHLGTLAAATVLLIVGSTATAVDSAGADLDLPDPTVPSAADPGGKAAAAGADNRSEHAEAALATVQAMFSGGDVRARRAVNQSMSATMALRDLAMLRSSLSADDRARADAYLARPTDLGTTGPFGDPAYTVVEATPVCGIHVCVHYVTSTVDAVSLADVSPANTIPDYVDLALATLEHVATTYIGAGYRAPKSDLTSDTNGSHPLTPGSVDPLTDIYLADIGPTPEPNDGPGIYGYCSSDDPHFEKPKTFKYFDASAFCVLDNDYKPTQFGTRSTPTENLQVTAAHEYFHAVQFAYDYWEDSWLLEATAVWMEDEVYDSIDDNLQYLGNSPLTRPHIPLDSIAYTHEYGDWIFFRYLTERFPTEDGGLPTLVRDIFRRVDAAQVVNGKPDQMSIQAVRSAVFARGVRFPAAFTRFGAINRHPARSYDEGTAYPASPLADSFGLSRSRPTTGWLTRKLNHLTNATLRIRPGSTLTASDWRLRLNLDLPATSRGSAATVQVYKKSGSISSYPITLSTVGDATKRFPFSVSSVKYVELTLTNASLRYECWQGTQWSCMGRPLDNKLPFGFRATAFRA